ncbi:MAG: beta-ketoacyl-[acyl-carrier-protein] synthase family protein [Gaiellaceae bacterium]
MKRVVVTGIGLATPLGVGTEETWRGLIEGRTGITPITSYDASSLRTQQAAEMADFDPEQFAARKTLRSMTRNDQLALAGASLAMKDAGLDFSQDGAGDRAALFVGSNKEISNPMNILEGSLFARNEDGSVDIRRLGESASSAFHPLFYVEGLQAASIFYISQAHSLKGANTYFAGTAESGLMAIGRAYRSVRRGEAEVALAGGYDDASSWWNMTKFDTLGLLTQRNDLGAAACRPYDAERTGTLLGEGAAFLVFEPHDRATARGARIYAEIVGFGSAYDAHRLITPDPEGRGLARAIERALQEGEAPADGIDYIAAHGSGTRQGDATEARAVKSVFGGNGKVVASSVKPATGHLIGGAGALNAAVAALAIQHGTVPPTLNLEHPDPACDGIDWVPREAREVAVRQALALARGFEGQNVAVLMRAA